MERFKLEKYKWSTDFDEDSGVKLMVLVSYKNCFGMRRKTYTEAYRASDHRIIKNTKSSTPKEVLEFLKEEYFAYRLRTKKQRFLDKINSY